MAGAATALALVAGAGTSSAMFVDYLADRADTGLHIVELTGPARALANFPR